MASDDVLKSPASVYGDKGDLKSRYPEADFKSEYGKIPFMEPNVDPSRESDDLRMAFEKAFGNEEGCEAGWKACCIFSGIGLCWLCCCRMQLIDQGQWGFVMHSGRPGILMPERYWFANPLTDFQGARSQGDDLIQCGPVTIVRVQRGSVGLAYDNSQPEVLLPGRHVRTAATFKYEKTVSLQNDLIEFGPIKLLTVKSGGVRVCYHSGKVEIFPEGRYSINSSTFVVQGFINTQQQNVKFDQHKVLLDGGISLLVEGLLTFQVIDPALLIKQLGERDLLQAVSQTTKAELSRVFSAIHLEQISTAQMESHKKEKKDPSSFLGGTAGTTTSAPTEEGETRNEICAQIIRSVRPIAEQWGVRVINFQLESTTLADRKYAAEYEEASLAMAKAKSNRRAIEATNDILIQKAKAAAASLKIEAEGQKTALLIQAEAKAEARRIEAKGRNDAAELMQNDFSKTYALAGQQVEFAGALKAKVLTVVPGSSVGSALLSQSAFTTTALGRDEGKSKS